MCEECGVRFISRLKLRCKLGDMYTEIYVYNFSASSSKLSSRSLRVGNEELSHTTQFQTTLYHTKVSGTMWSLAGGGDYFSLKRSIDQHCWPSIAGACIYFGRAGSGSDFGTNHSRNVYLVPLIAFASSIWHSAVSKA